ncbi:MAG: type III pantothenate kinase [Anaerolineae bacterium]|nr:type III pantothenate kinase [Anaerolineae bacterium]
MLLAIDVGNTNIHFGLYDGQMWRNTWRARTAPLKMGDEYAVLLRSFFAEDGLTFDDVNAIVMASVVPALTATLTQMSERYMKRIPLNIEPGVKTGIRVLIDNPREVGPDRVVNAIAVKKLYGAPAIVIDFGTATTYDVLNAEGDYIGGAIAPGIGMAHDALVSRTARLYNVDLIPPPSAIGHNTVHAMQSGLFLGYIAMIEGLVARIRADLQAPDTRVIATGGLAPLFAEHTQAIEEIAPNLTLDGLRLIWEINEQVSYEG